jgi:drug/metabolite transporter (DMT)-like permease
VIDRKNFLSGDIYLLKQLESMIKYIVMVFVGACSFGILSTFAKLAYREGYSAAEITFSQAFISMVLLWLFTFLQRKTGQPANRNIWLSLLLTGATIGLTTFVYYLSVLYIPASLAVVILMQFTWMGALLEWIFFKKKPGWKQITIMVLILGATVLASGLLNIHAKEIPLKGILLALGSALLYAMYIVASSRTIKQISSLRKSAIIMTGSALGIFIANAGTLVADNHLNMELLKWALFFAMFGTIIPQVLFAKGIPGAGAGISAIIMTVELPVAVITAHIILNEPVTLTQWIGIIVMLLAMTLMKV